jgi:hypothetical protein
VRNGYEQGLPRYFRKKLNISFAKIKYDSKGVVIVPNSCCKDYFPVTAYHDITANIREKENDLVKLALARDVDVCYTEPANQHLASCRPTAYGFGAFGDFYVGMAFLQWLTAYNKQRMANIASRLSIKRMRV